MVNEQTWTLVDYAGNTIPLTQPSSSISIELSDLMAQQQAKSRELDILNNELLQLKRDDSKYSIGQHKDNALVIVNAHTRWVVYYSENRSVHFYKEFEVFEKAKAHFLSELR